MQRALLSLAFGTFAALADMAVKLGKQPTGTQDICCELDC